MIPSANTQEEVEAAKLNPKALLICDCCHVQFCNSPYPFVNPAKLIEVPVGGVNYIAHDDECGRALFMIHHQYALQKAGRKNECGLKATNPLADLVRYAAQGACGDGAIEDSEEALLMRVAEILKKAGIDTVDCLEQQLSPPFKG